jgi:hypothetical protein
MHCKQIWKDGGGVWKFSGVLRFDDIMRLLLKRNSHCRFRKAEYLIQDLEGVTGIELSEAELETLAEYNHDSMGLAPNLKMAFITDQESYQEPLENFIDKMKGSSWQLKVFDRFDAAYEWAVRERWEALMKPSVP